MLNGVWALIPVKDFRNSKQRLGGAISVSSRSRLAEAMFRDVLNALNSVLQLEHIAIVTKERRAIQIAAEFNALVIRESENRGQTEAVAQATEVLLHRGVRTMLALPGDVPFITKEDVEAVLEAGSFADIVLVPAHDKRGTNAVLLTPPNILALKFGNDSFHPHLSSAQAASTRVKVLDLPNIGLDVDNPCDLIALAEWPKRAARTQTDAVLAEIQRVQSE